MHGAELSSIETKVFYILYMEENILNLTFLTNPQNSPLGSKKSKKRLPEQTSKQLSSPTPTPNKPFKAQKSQKLPQN